MRTWHAVPIALLLALSLPTVAQQDEGQPYFSLSSNRTFGVGEKPTLQLWAQGVDSLQFRVYRVNDPVKFFESLGDEHRFGGRAQRPVRELTMIEKIHRWKRNSRTAMRNLFRSQYSADSRAAVHHWIAETDQKPVAHQGETQFAGLPLLNPQQVVTVWQQNVPRGNRWDAQTVPVNVKDKGLYLVEATNGTLQAYTIISITNMAVIAKGAPGRVRARVVNRISGAPVANSPAVLWYTSQSGEQGRRRAAELARVQTDADGLVNVALDDPKPESLLVMAHRGDDFAVASLSGYPLRTDSQANLMGYVYTDRPVYRPGHTVHFRAILRNEMAAGYQVATGRNVDVEVQDSDGKQVYRRSLPLSAMGTVHGEFELPPAAALGYYGVEIHAGEGSANGGFNVEEYKKPEYEVKVTPSKKRVVQGEPLQAVIEAKYYYGEPVANAKVKYAVHRSRYWMPWYIDEDDEQSASDQDDTWSQKEEQEEQSGRLDANGKLTIQVPTEDAKVDLVYRVEARVTDQANREISGTGFALATRGSFYVHIEPMQYLYQPGEQAQFQVETRDYEGNAVPRVSFNVSLRKYDGTNRDHIQVGQTSGVTDAQGRTRVTLPVESGSFDAVATARTPEGREITDNTWVWVTGGISWYREGEQRVDLVPDKKTYKPGEKARVLIVTGVPDAYVWVTSEGRTVNFSQMVHAKGGSATVEVPIVSEYAPNFFLNAVFLNDQHLYQGSKSIKVPPVEQQLTVDLKASKPQFRPGDSGAYTIDAKDSAGRPVQAEFSLGVVDEAIYAIRKETVQDILGFFYGRKWNRVYTDTSLSYYFQGEAGKRRMQLARIKPRKALAIIKPEKMVEPKIRKAFPDTMFWTADLRTDARGHGQVSVTFPDALTTWRATARGITSDSKVGSAVDRTIVRKNLILRLALPRFFREGDEVTVSALVDNYLAGQKTVRVSLDIQGLELVEGTTKEIEVPSKGEGKVDFRVRATRAGNAVFTGKALTDEESDAMELSIPVVPFGVKLNIPKSGSLGEGQGEARADLAYPADAIAGSRKLLVSVSPSVAGTIFGALEYLTTFPYGCTEQTMSSFLPNVVVSQAVKSLGLKTGINPADLEKKIRAGMDRLYDFQHEDGGWGWWKTDDSSEFMTAYVISGLKQARAAGYNVKPEAIDNAARWLNTRWPKLEKIDADLKAYAALSAGGHLDDIWNLRGKLSPYGLAMLGLSLQQANDARAEEIAGMLEKSVQTNDSEAWWKLDRDPLMDFYNDTSPETTAYAMKFLAKQRPQSPLLPKAALYLVNHRDQGYYWSSTKQTAMVIYGLTDYLARSGELHPDASVTVFVNDRQVAQRHFGDAEALAPAQADIEIPADQLAPGNRVRIVKSGKGRVYWSARAVYFSTAAKVTKAGSAELNLLRDYFKLTPMQEGNKVVYRTEPFSGTAARGDVIAVRLTVTGSNWRYLMIEDPIPAGTEFIERDDLYEMKEKPAWWNFWFTRREFHDDRATLFQTWFGSGQRTYFYLLKVVTPGAFRASPARVEPMYQPGFLATTEAKTMEVK
jgi:uncharacterized protein YfaS (alpha-2-macroglobulin family)